MRFMAYLRATENVNGPQKYQNVVFVIVTIAYIGESFRVFPLAVFLTKLQCRANFLKIGNIRVEPPTLAVLPHTRIKCMVPYLVTLTVTRVKLQN